MERSGMERSGMERIGVIIVAGGRGLRCGGTLPKQFAMLGGKPVLAHTIDTFAETLPGAEIVVVLPEELIPFWKNLAARFEVKRHRTVEGGCERFESVKCGLYALKSDPEIIAVQDAVRPLVSPEMIRRVAEAAATHGAAIPVVGAVDSFREVVPGGSRIIDRNRLRIVQTPQMFRAETLRAAYAADFRPEFTDDASVVEALGEAIHLVDGERGNIKITTPEDFTVAEALLNDRKERFEEAAAAPQKQ